MGKLHYIAFEDEADNIKEKVERGLEHIWGIKKVIS